MRSAVTTLYQIEIFLWALCSALFAVAMTCFLFALNSGDDPKVYLFPSAAFFAVSSINAIRRVRAVQRGSEIYPKTKAALAWIDWLVVITLPPIVFVFIPIAFFDYFKERRTVDHGDLTFEPLGGLTFALGFLFIFLAMSLFHLGRRIAARTPA